MQPLSQELLSFQFNFHWKRQRMTGGFLCRPVRKLPPDVETPAEVRIAATRGRAMLCTAERKEPVPSENWKRKLETKHWGHFESRNEHFSSLSARTVQQRY